MIESLSGIYCGPPPVPGMVWARWNLDPALVAGLLALAFVIGRSRPGAAAVAVLLIAFVSPLCALSAALFSARAAHHVLIVAVAAPLVALAWPARRAGAAPLHLALSTAFLWGWHAPAAYDLALSNVAAYWAMQATLFGPAFLFWRAVFAREADAPGALLLVTGAYVQMALLGALLAFGPLPLYEIHRTAPLAFGLAPLADQQLGGLVMWVPGGVPYALFAALIARRGWGNMRGAGV
jgi:putative membrane protein